MADSYQQVENLKREDNSAGRLSKIWIVSEGKVKNKSIKIRKAISCIAVNQQQKQIILTHF